MQALLKTIATIFHDFFNLQSLYVLYFYIQLVVVMGIGQWVVAHLGISKIPCQCCEIYKCINAYLFASPSRQHYLADTSSVPEVKLIGGN